MGLLAGSVSDEFAATLEKLTPENFDAFLEMFRSGFGDFDQTLLGDLDFDQFLTAIGFAESALDGMSETATRANAALRNTPAGFKIAAARFRATDTSEDLVKARTSGGGISAGDIVGRPIGGGGRGGGAEDLVRGLKDALADMNVTRQVTIENITLEGVQDPDVFLEQLETQIEWKARSGGSVIATNTQR
jgi:hypothetical protein